MKILVPLNGSAHSETVLGYVGALAHHWQARLLLLWVLDPMAMAGDPTAAGLLGRETETRGYAEDYLRRVSERFPGLEVQTACKVGSASETICWQAAQENCDLIVFAPHGHKGLERWLFGSVAEEVARHSPCPVLLVRGETNVRIHHVLVPSDGSDESTRVCGRLSSFVPEPTRLTLLHCVEHKPLDQTMRTQLDACLHNHPTWQLRILEGKAPSEIVKWVFDSDCDLIAMATHGRGGLQHLWAGSVTEHVARQAPCPVLVFPPACLNH